MFTLVPDSHLMLLYALLLYYRYTLNYIMKFQCKWKREWNSLMLLCYLYLSVLIFLRCTSASCGALVTWPSSCFAHSVESCHESLSRRNEVCFISLHNHLIWEMGTDCSIVRALTFSFLPRQVLCCHSRWIGWKKLLKLIFLLSYCPFCASWG